MNSTEDAKKAYMGLDPSVDKAITLGFAGFNEVSGAPGANIAPQGVDGGVSGTLSVSGQVDNGASSNKTMRLTETLSSYSDDGHVTYATDQNTLPSLTMDLKNIPTGTLDGTLSGSFLMSGELTGQVSLALTFAGQLEAAADGGVQRKTGTTHITGTATSPAGTYNVDVTR